MAEVKLLPCPFCGKPPKTQTNRNGGLVVFCNSLECELLSIDGEAGDENENSAVIAAWNTRTLDARLSELKDTLVEAAREACLVLMDEGYGGANPTLQRLDAALSAAALFEQEKAALEKRQ